MEYLIAKQLKDAGFPKTKYGGYDSAETEAKVREAIGQEPLYTPTLSELIEACGDGFQVLKHAKPLWLCYVNGGKWIEAYTPEEAVAQLYLALKGK